MVARPSLLVTLFRVCAVAVVVFILLSLAWWCPRELPRRRVFFWLFWLFEREGLSSRRYRSMRACQHRYASPSSPGCPTSGFKQPFALMKGSTLFECVRVFRVVQAVAPIFSKGGSVGCRCK